MSEPERPEAVQPGTVQPEPVQTGPAQPEPAANPALSRGARRDPGQQRIVRGTGSWQRAQETARTHTGRGAFGDFRADRTNWPTTQYNFRRLRAYERSGISRDVFAGLGVAAYLVPQVMAYATLAGVPPAAGLWAALAPMAIYAVVGTSRLLSVGPESTTALMTAAAVGPLVVGNPEQYPATASLCALAVGLICIVAGMLRLGFVSSLLSRPVLIGYLAGVAVIMMSGQLGKLFGVTIEADDPLPQILEAIRRTGEANAATAALGVGVLTMLFVGSYLLPKLPWPLLAVMAATVVTTLAHLDEQGVKVVGQIPSGLPPLSLPTALGELPMIMAAAAGIAVVAFTDNMLTARAFAEPNEEIDADSELRALGLANVGAGLSSGFPVSSSGSRTALAKASLATGPGYGLVTVAALIAVLWFAGPILANFPMAALGGLVVYAALRIMQFGEFRWLWHFRRTEFWLGIATLLAVLLLDLLQGVVFAVALSAAVMLARVARPNAATLGMVEGLAGMHDTDEYRTTEIPGLVVFRYDSPLFFANAEDFRSRVMAAVATRCARGDEVKEVLLNCEANVDADSTAVAAMDTLITGLQERGIVVALARVHVDLADLLERAGILDLVGRDQIFPTLPTAVAAYDERFRVSDS